MRYCHQDLDMEVAILSTDGINKNIDITISSMSKFSKNYEYFVVMPKCLKNGEYKHPLIIAQDTITEMFNEGMKRLKKPWIYFVFAGSKMRKNIDSKLSAYITTKKDVLFPVVDRVWNFVDGSMNGIIISKDLIEETGHFISGNDLEFTKLEWADRAINKGAKFKGIVNSLNF